MIERFYPSSENFLLGLVNEKDLYAYIFSGFALVKIEDEYAYVSFCLTKPTIMIKQTPELEEIFRKKEDDKSNTSDFVRLMSRLKIIQVHNGDKPTSWEKVKIELEKEENISTLKNYKTTIETVVKGLFPNFE